MVPCIFFIDIHNIRRPSIPKYDIGPEGTCVKLYKKNVLAIFDILYNIRLETLCRGDWGKDKGKRNERKLYKYVCHSLVGFARNY